MDAHKDLADVPNEREEYYAQIQEHNMAPLWENLTISLLPNQKLSLYLIIGIMQLSVHSSSILQTLFQRQRQNAVF